MNDASEAQFIQQAALMQQK